MDTLTVGAFAASLYAQIGEHGGDKIESIEPSDDGYLLKTKTYSGNPVSLLINAATAGAAVSDEKDDEIAEYSERTNIAYMSLVAGRLLVSNKIPDAPLPELIAFLLQLAEEFEMEYGSELVGGNTVKAISEFAEAKLIERYGK